MTMYLLLRNNKQSGPYSLEDLKNMGLKPYDLVWLEGKSAAWRYPSEIEELKQFAPVVEEQPFDRFYKRPGATTETTSPASNGNKETTTIAFQPSISASGESSPTTGKRIIYVTLPAGKSTPAPTRETMRETPIREIREVPRDMPRETERPRIAGAESETPVSTKPAIGEYPSLASHRETSPVEFSPRRRSHSKERLIRIFGVGLCIVALLAAGIFIGLSLNKESLGLQKRIASRTTPPLSVKPTGVAVQPPAVPAVNTAVPATTSEKSAAPAINTAGPSGDDKAKPANDETSVNQAGKRARKQKGKEKLPSALMPPPVQKDSALATVPVVTREAVHRTVAEPSPVDVNETAKTTLANEVSVGANGYTVGTFGGINDLQVTVTNRSAHPLDLVVVEVKYIQANKKVYKTENLNFHDIGPGAALMQEAPRSSRGIRVQYRIISISSKELGLSYSGL